MILTLKGVEFIILTVYLWHTEGFTDRNIKILYQISMLKYLSNLPIIALGDFNIPFKVSRNLIGLQD